MSAALEREPVRVEDAEELETLQRIEDQISGIGRGAPALLGPDGEVVTLPKTVFDLLRQLVGDLARGRAVSIVPVHAELTTQQAADLLNVSRPFLVKQLEAGKIPYRMVGTHRRIRMEELMAYRRQQGRERREALDELARVSQTLGLYE